MIEKIKPTGDEPSNRKSAKGAERAVFTVREAADLLGLGIISAYSAVRRGDVPSVRVGRRIVIPKEAFLAKFRDAIVG